MDWPSHLDPFLAPNCKDSFTCIGAVENKNCTVLQVFNAKESAEFQVCERVLLKDSDWDDWFKECDIFSDVNEEDAYVSPSDLPKDGVCILFVPRAPKLSEDIEAALTDLPLEKATWEKVSKAFYLLPSHIHKAILRKSTSMTSISRYIPYDNDAKEILWMHVARTSNEGPDTFALASTYIEHENLTLAMFIGCSSEQIKRVQDLLQRSEDAITHPLLMLGMCAEMQLDRCKTLVEARERDCLKTTRSLRRLGDVSNGGITWELIDEIRYNRDKSKRAEEEVNITKRQLGKALPPAFRSIPNQFESNRNTNGNSNSPTNSFFSSQYGPDRDDEITGMFKERFADIFGEFEGLVARCRISVEEMSFTADIIRIELAWEESQKISMKDAKASVKQAKMSTVIAFVAMLYLPMTTTATIFAMPVFQFPNNWRDARYNVVQKGNASDPSSAARDGNGTDLPVFSGYFWIYFAISLFLTLATTGGWWLFTREKGTHWVPVPAFRMPNEFKTIVTAMLPSKSPPHPHPPAPGRAPPSPAPAGRTATPDRTGTGRGKEENEAGSTESSRGDKLSVYMDKNVVETEEQQDRGAYSAVLPKGKSRPRSPGGIV